MPIMPTVQLRPLRERSTVRLDLTDRWRALSTAGQALTIPIILDARFWEAPASVKWHHNYDGGLAEHTLEVVEVVDSISSLSGSRLNHEDLLVAAFWHDYAKIWDYEKVEGGWDYTNHADDHGHLVRSYAEFLAHARTTEVSETRALKIGSLLLSHHGQKAWGSPIEPRSPEAWALHLADMTSVRVLCDRK